MEILWIKFCPLLAAVFCGGLVGLERYIHEKPAGMRTNILICLGACIFTIISKNIEGADPGRIAAQIVTGIGFLGAGAIIHGVGGVQGLTTAAGIWVVAAIGMACGSGMYLMAFGSTALSLAVLLLLQPIEKKMDKLHKNSQPHQ